MIVCLGHRISDRDIEHAAQDGTPDFEALQDETCIARNCACCEECARDIFSNACAKVGAARAVAKAAAARPLAA